MKTHLQRCPATNQTVTPHSPLCGTHDADRTHCNFNAGNLLQIIPLSAPLWAAFSDHKGDIFLSLIDCIGLFRDCAGHQHLSGLCLETELPQKAQCDSGWHSPQDIADCHDAHFLGYRRSSIVDEELTEQAKLFLSSETK